MCYKIRRHLRKKNIDLLNELVYDIFDEEFISTGEMLHRIRRFEGYEDVIIIFLLEGGELQSGLVNKDSLNADGNIYYKCVGPLNKYKRDKKHLDYSNPVKLIQTDVGIKNYFFPLWQVSRIREQINNNPHIVPIAFIDETDEVWDRAVSSNVYDDPSVQRRCQSSSGFRLSRLELCLNILEDDEILRTDLTSTDLEKSLEELDGTARILMEINEENENELKRLEYRGDVPEFLEDLKENIDSVQYKLEMLDTIREELIAKIKTRHILSPKKLSPHILSPKKLSPHILSPKKLSPNHLRLQDGDDSETTTFEIIQELFKFAMSSENYVYANRILKLHDEDLLEEARFGEINKACPVLNGDTTQLINTLIHEARYSKDRKEIRRLNDLSHYGKIYEIRNRNEIAQWLCDATSREDNVEVQRLSRLEPSQFHAERKGLIDFLKVVKHFLDIGDRDGVAILREMNHRERSMEVRRHQARIGQINKANEEDDFVEEMRLSSLMRSEWQSEMEQKRGIKRGRSGLSLVVEKNFVNENLVEKNGVCIYETTPGNYSTVYKQECGGGGNCFYFSVASFLLQTKANDTPQLSQQKYIEQKKQLSMELRKKMCESLSNIDDETQLLYCEGDVKPQPGNMQRRVNTLVRRHLRYEEYAIQPVIVHLLPFLFESYGVSGVIVVRQNGNNELPNVIYLDNRTTTEETPNDVFILVVMPHNMAHYQIGYYNNGDGTKNYIFKRRGVLHSVKNIIIGWKKQA